MEVLRSLEGVPWILALNVDRHLLLLESEHDIVLLHGSELWVDDGNFDYQPNGFAQLYTVHGFFAGEAKAAVHIKNERNVQVAKASLQTRLAGWIESRIPTDHDLRARLLRHLDRVQHLIG